MQAELYSEKHQNLACKAAWQRYKPTIQTLSRWINVTGCNLPSNCTDFVTACSTYLTHTPLPGARTVIWIHATPVTSSWGHNNDMSEAQDPRARNQNKTKFINLVCIAVMKLRWATSKQKIGIDLYTSPRENIRRTQNHKGFCILTNVAKEPDTKVVFKQQWMPSMQNPGIGSVSQTMVKRYQKNCTHQQ